MKPDGVILSALIGRIGIAVWSLAGLSAELTHVLGEMTDLATQAALFITAILAMISKIREARRMK